MIDRKEAQSSWNDAIVEEVRAARLSLLEQVDFDLERLGNQLRDEQRRSGHDVVRLPLRKPVGETGEAA